MMGAPAHPDLAGRCARNLTGFDVWLAAALSVLVVGALALGGQGNLLRLAIPVAGTLVAFFLYVREPILYIQYTLWVWFLSPLVRRLVDWRFGWMDPNMVLITPLLVSGVAVLTVLRPRHEEERNIPPAFVLCGAAILYGFVVGLMLKPSVETVYGLFNWMCPLLFGLHVYRNWRSYDEFRDAISETFLWAVLLLGIYGIVQFFSPPDWDLYWLTNVQYQSISPSFGDLSVVRVWSTLNSPGPFANVLMVGLLLLLEVRSPVKLPAAIVGYVSFGLSMVRASWLSWLIGLCLIVRKTNPKAMARALLLMCVLAGCLVPILTDARVAPVLVDRVGTFTDLGHDESMDARLDMYRFLLNEVIRSPFGRGVSNATTLGNVTIDSGILSLLFSLGWLGSLLFAAGVLSLFLTRKSVVRSGVAAASIMVAIVAQVLGGNVFVAVTGVIFWTFAGLQSGSVRYQEAGVNS